MSTEEWWRFLKYYFLYPTKFDLSHPNQRILGVCRQDSLPCLDLLDPFRSHYEGGKTHLYRAHGDMHFNENGQALAARELSTVVRQRFERQGLTTRAPGARPLRDQPVRMGRVREAHRGRHQAGPPGAH